MEQPCIHVYIVTKNVLRINWVFLLYLQVTSAAELDYEKQKTHEITIRATDNGNPSLHFDKVFTVDVTDVNEAPYLVKLTGNKVLTV